MSCGGGGTNPGDFFERIMPDIVSWAHTNTLQWRNKEVLSTKDGLVRAGVP